MAHGEVATGNGWELRLGRWQDVLADVEHVDAVITDPPYSERTHKGQRVGAALRMPTINYAPLTEPDAEEMVERAAALQPSWSIFFGDHTTFRWLESSWERLGWMAFAPVFVRDNPTPRFSGDGPAFGLEFISVARPRRRVNCGSLPAYYNNTLVGFGSHGRGVPGQKPLGLMRAIVRDYSRPGEFICDLCAGAATTLLAAAMEGRRAIGAEMDPATFAKAVERLRKHDAQGQLFPIAPTPEPKQGSMW